MKMKFTYRLAKFLINILAFTWRIEYKNANFSRKSIVVFWHGLMLPGWYAFKNNNAIAVISLSKDGELLANLLSDWGFDFIRGSSSHGGKDVLNEIVEYSGKKWILMTPDGPRGPRNKMKAGAFIAAQRSGVPVYLCGINVYCKYTFKKSWDKFILPMPFSKIEINYTGPFFIDKNLSRDETDRKIKELENKLKSM